MFQNFKNFAEEFKYYIMLLVYVVYMTWWASSVTSGIQRNSEDIRDYTLSNTALSSQIIILSENNKYMASILSDNANTIKKIQEEHIRCAILIQGLVDKLDTVGK